MLQVNMDALHQFDGTAFIRDEGRRSEDPMRPQINQLLKSDLKHRLFVAPVNSVHGAVRISTSVFEVLKNPFFDWLITASLVIDAGREVGVEFH